MSQSPSIPVRFHFFYILFLAILFFAINARNSLLAQEDNLPVSPDKAAQQFVVPDDLRFDLVLSEPQIAQPVFCNFDEQGRIWVVEYRQYPEPAGLKVISKDRYYRNVYDKIPAAPPNHVKGKDRISIHEDTDGDGKYDKHKVFVDGLNIVTSVCRGRGGVWVLNPPYLLFYPDKNNDDIPDGDPIVHLAGFGLEDTHSCTNSLRWGPDGWLYAAQGSTVSGNIIRPGIDKKPVRSMGQLIWRYHPEKKLYEIFAEGGGNAFGVEVDSAGRIFSGHNGGNTRGFHYPQGGYLQKGFTKHGALSNPYAFGFFPHMKHPNVERFTHNFIIYEAESLPTKYRGHLFGVEPLQGRVVEADIQPRGSTFETRDLQRPVTTPDTWFTPVDIKLGPDGGIYVCDWYDDNVSHLEASVGKTDKKDGRIYRLIGRDHKSQAIPDLGQASSAKLVEFLEHPNRWHRQTALRLLGDRKDRSVLPKLASNLKRDEGQLALESLWATYQIGGLKALLATNPLEHANPQVRKWAFRLICDDRQLPNSLKQSVPRFASLESNVEARTQIASSAKRLPANECLALVKELLVHESDTSDPYQPLLLWWAIESKCDDPDRIVQFIDSTEGFWSNRIVADHIATRLVKRFTLPGTNRDFLALASILTSARQANPALAKKMLAEMETTTKTLTNLVFPDPLLKVIIELGGASLELQVRQNDMKSVRLAVQKVSEPKTDAKQRVRLIRALGDIRYREGVDLFLTLLEKEKDVAIQIACLESLRSYDSPVIGSNIVKLTPNMPTDSFVVAESVLISRPAWTTSLLNAVETNKISKDRISKTTPRRMLFHGTPEIIASVKKVFGDVQGATGEALRVKIDTYFKELQAGEGSPYEGKKLFVKNCSKCHRLYQNGGDIGPNLTAYQRNDLKLMLLHVVNPNAEIREGFENIMFALDDGRVVSGFIKEEGNRQVVVRTAEGIDVRLDKETIENQKAVPNSLMPTGLLDELTAQQRRDLFAFLRSTQPLNN